MLRSIVLLLLFLAGGTALPAQTADRFAPVRATIKRFLDSTNSASVAVAVAKDRKIIWEEGFGWANREKMIPATKHTMYSLASISKPFTARPRSAPGTRWSRSGFWSGQRDVGYRPDHVLAGVLRRIETTALRA